MSVGEVVDAPSWISWPGADPAEIDAPFELRVETRFEGSVISSLEERGHRLRRMGNYGIGSRHQLIEMDDAGILYGASDPRVPGVALGI